MGMELKKYGVILNETPMECLCDITSKLDELAGIKVKKHKFCVRHYLLINEEIEYGKIPIRFPGDTVGIMYIDDNCRIEAINISKSYVDDYRYPKNINKKLKKKYIGTKLELKDFLRENSPYLLKYLKCNLI